MANEFDVYTSGFDEIRRPVRPDEEAGTSGTAISYGYVVSREKNNKLIGSRRYETAMDILQNAAVVAAGMRYFLNIVAKPKWKMVPADKSSQAKEVADFVEMCMHNMSDSWPRCVRRMAAFRFYGFGTHEWTTARDPDTGRIGYASLESRPWHTVNRWEVDPKGTILGIEQLGPLTGESFYIPRAKLVYLVDDSLTDSPEGLGLWRMLVEPFERFKSYSQIEAMGFERDLRGIPVGSAPYQAIKQMVDDGELTQDQADAITAPIERFVKMAAKSTETGIVMDSSTYLAETETGENVSAARMFDLKLLTAGGTGFADIGNAIDRCQYQMAMLCGTENMLVGSGDQGSKALSEDKTRNFSMNVDSTQMDVVSSVNKDFIPPLMLFNGIPRNLWPKAKTESAAYMDASVKAQIMASLGNAGAVTRISDPAVNDIRIEAGLHEVTKEMVSMDEMDAMNDKSKEEPSQLQKIFMQR